LAVARKIALYDRISGTTGRRQIHLVPLRGNAEGPACYAVT
jgi:hypothetical protein